MKNPIPSVPMLSGAGGQLFLGIGLLLALVVLAKKTQAPTIPPR